MRELEQEERGALGPWEEQQWMIGCRLDGVSRSLLGWEGWDRRVVVRLLEGRESEFANSHLMMPVQGNN